MLNAPRWLLSMVSIAFGAYHALIGALAWRSYDNHFYLALAIAIYLASLAVSVAASPGLAIGRPYGVLVATGAVATVVVSSLGIYPGHIDPYSTWYVGAMAALLGILAARGQGSLAWLAAGIVIWQVYLEIGLAGLGEVGLEGIPILIGAASATAFALKRADSGVDELQKSAVAAEAAIVSSKASANERRNRLQKVLERALPALSYISANQGQLSDDQKSKLLQLEASLRDDIRGRSLINDSVREAAAAARARGIEVLILDEGGLNEVSEAQLKHTLAKVVGALNSVASGKVVIRSPRGEKWLVTVIATRPGTESPDLWLKL